MDRQQAIRIIEDTFKNSFDEGRFTHFVRNLFNEIDEDKAFTMTGNYIPDAYKDHVKLYKRIAKYKDPADNELDIIVVNLKKDSSIERARSMQRNFLAWYLKNRGEKDAALVAYYTEGVEDWRFSYVRMEYRTEKNEKGKIKAVTDLTPARRYSFLVGKHEPNHTAQQQLVPLLEDTKNNPTLEQIEQAFNIESVTKEFFKKYRLLFDDVNDHIEKELKKSKQLREELASKGIDASSFTKKLLGQIVFLYFIQKKGWLGVPKDQTWGKGDRQFLRTLLQDAVLSKENFYSEYLEYLFYEALATEHRGGSDASYYPKFDCKIPFLNGGLFEADYDWKKLEISLPNTYFTNSNKTKEGDIGDGILDVFDRYNFTVKEDEPLEKEVAVDPEMLGKVFENLLEVKDRKSKGAFYTPREIVHYMCQESLINFLDVALNGQPASFTKLGDTQTDAFGNKATKGQLAIEEENVDIRVPRTDIEEFIRHGIEAVENDLRVETKGKETQSYSYKIPTTIRENAKDIDEALENIRICDPAIGSGAFPVGIMNEIVQARHILQTYIKKKNNIYDFKRHAIQECIYGVDIDHSAIDIAKLRLWLSLVVDEEDFYKIKPLPNLDYKIVEGNSLIGLPYVSQQMETLEKLKDQFFDETNVKEKAKLRERINHEINDILKRMSRQVNFEIKFDFQLFFSEVFNRAKGFDIVIANPPYVGESGHKEIFQPIAKGNLGIFHQRRLDLFYYFFHLALNLGKEGASIAFITTNYYLTATGARKLRKDINERSIIKNLINFNEFKIFESALGQHNMISILKKAKNENAYSENCIIQNQGIATPEILRQIFDKTNKETSYYKVTQKELYDGDEYYIRLAGKSDNSTNSVQTILQKLKKQGELLGTICNVNQGIVTGANKVTEKHISKFKIDAEPGDGIFVLSPKELKEKRISVKSEHIKKWFKNSDIKKYWTNTSEKEYVLYFKDKKEKQYIEKEILEHFEEFKELLIERLSVCKKNKFQWNIVSKWIDRGEYYLLFYPRKQEIFESPKIVVPQRSPQNVFGYNEITWCAASDVYFITQLDSTIFLKYVLAILNSKLVYLWLYHRGKRKGENLELFVKPLSEIPIKRISEGEQKHIIKLVDRILAVKRTNPQADMSKLEGEIDQIVYELYGLTKEEIAIVEGN